eukprot:2077-Chlamydomonas_euryale.AAC.3
MVSIRPERTTTHADVPSSLAQLAPLGIALGRTVLTTLICRHPIFAKAMAALCISSDFWNAKKVVEMAGAES